MKAFVLAAGIGSRLRPITDTRPKALVEVEGVPMIERVITKLRASGFDHITVNVYHFADMIIDFLRAHNNFGVNITISDERPDLLDTGGAIKHAAPLFGNNEPVLVHNVDIISNCDLNALMQQHNKNKADATMLVSSRTTNRYLLWTKDTSTLCGWTNKQTGEVKPKTLCYSPESVNEYAYSGIQVISPAVWHKMDNILDNRFSIIDFYLNNLQSLSVKAYAMPELKILDIGKPETLHNASQFLAELQH